MEPTYYNRQWHYPDGWTATQIVEHALRFALKDYERSNAAGRHPGHEYTQGPQALADALRVVTRV
jgi:hypothetical protein